MKSLATRQAQRAHLAAVNAGLVKDSVALRGETADGKPHTGQVDFSKGAAPPVEKPGVGFNDPAGNGQGNEPKPKTIDEMTVADLDAYIAARGGTASGDKTAKQAQAKSLPETIVAAPWGSAPAV